MFVAVADAGIARFRPIVLTTTTTFGGLMPMMLESSVQAQFMIPMAVSLGFGVLFATAISLILVPASYLVLEDFRRLCGASPTHSAVPGADRVWSEKVGKSSKVTEKKADDLLVATRGENRGVHGREHQQAHAATGKGSQDNPREAFQPEYTTPLDPTTADAALMNQFENAYRAGYQVGRSRGALQIPRYDNPALGEYWQRGWHAGTKGQVERLT
jgi:hypothetical protein